MHRGAPSWWRWSALCAALAACASSGKASPVVLTQADDQREVRVARGREIEVRLSSSPGTGFLWQVEPLDAARLESLGKETLPPAQARPGAESVTVFRFRALSAGSTALSFRLVRPWEHAAPPARRFEVRLVLE
jgi:predicted secreted protein